MADKPKRPAELTAKQKRFVEEYLIDLNATQAAIRAGYAENSAEVTGSKLLRNAKVAKAVQEAMDKRSERTEITQDMVLKELAKIGFSNMQDYVNVQGAEAFVDLSAVTRDQFAAVSEITSETLKTGGDDEIPVLRTKIKLSDKKASLELIGKHLKMFTDKVEHAGADGAPLQVNVVRFTDQE